MLHRRKEPSKRSLPGSPANSRTAFLERQNPIQQIVAPMTVVGRQKKRASPSMFWKNSSSKPLLMRTCKSGMLCDVAGELLSGKKACERKACHAILVHRTI